MTTNIQLIEGALREINVISEIDSASAEQGSYGLRKLNQLMEFWKGESIDLKWFAQTSTTATAPVPDWAEIAVESALAILMAPKYGATVSPELAAIADNAVSGVRRKLISEQLDNADMSHLPRGSGRAGYNILTDSFD